MASYFISDTHFNGEGIIQIENRPFPTVYNMNNAMKEMWNYTIGSEDEVWHLGDFIWNSGEWDDKFKEEIRDLLFKLNGYKILVMGNHDRKLTPAEWIDLGFAKVYDRPVLFEDFYILSHEPVYVTENMPYANIYGHVHGNPNYKDYSSNGFCVCVERIAYTPISFDAIKRKILSIPKNNGIILPDSISIDPK